MKPINDKRDTTVIADEILRRSEQRGTPDKVRDEAWQANYDRMNLLKEVLAKRFATLHNWKYTKKSFSLLDLGARPTGDDGDADFDPSAATGRIYDASLLDHPYFFTDRTGRAAAIAAHLYDYDEEDAAEYCALATAWGLKVSVITDFPSWYYPTATTLVVWQRGSL
jgi:hypothetical protein